MSYGRACSRRSDSGERREEARLRKEWQEKKGEGIGERRRKFSCPFSPIPSPLFALSRRFPIRTPGTGHIDLARSGNEWKELHSLLVNNELNSEASFTYYTLTLAKMAVSTFDHLFMLWILKSSASSDLNLSQNLFSEISCFDNKTTTWNSMINEVTKYPWETTEVWTEKE